MLSIDLLIQYILISGENFNISLSISVSYAEMYNLGIKITVCLPYSSTFS